MAMSATSVMPTHIAEWAGVHVSGDWNGTEDAGVWPFDAAGQLCAGNATDMAAVVGHARANSIYARRQIFINVYLVVGLCAFGFVGNALTVAVLRRDKVGTLSILVYYSTISYIQRIVYLSSAKTGEGLRGDRPLTKLGRSQNPKQYYKNFKPCLVSVAIVGPIGLQTLGDRTRIKTMQHCKVALWVHCVNGYVNGAIWKCRCSWCRQ